MDQKQKRKQMAAKLSAIPYLHNDINNIDEYIDRKALVNSIEDNLTYNIIWLRYVRGYKIEEVCTKYGISKRTVINKCNDGLDYLISKDGES